MKQVATFYTSILTNRLVGPLGIICYILIDNVLRTLLLGQGLVLSVLKDELGLQLHNRVLNACAGQVLYLALGNGWRGISTASLVTPAVVMASLHVEGHRVVSLAGIIGTLIVVVGLLAESALTNLTPTFRLRVCSDQAGLRRLLIMRRHWGCMITTYKLASILDRQGCPSSMPVLAVSLLDLLFRCDDIRS